MTRQRQRAPSSTVSPPSYRSVVLVDGSERDPLIATSHDPGRSAGGSRPTIIILMIIALIIGGFLGGFIQYATSQSIYDPTVRDYTRRQWEAERQGWERERQEEAKKRHCQWEAERREWEREQEEAEERRRQWEAEEAEGRRRQWEAERRGWERESQREQGEAEERRRQWEAERRGWESERQEEAKKRHCQWEAERRGWERERQEEAKERHRQWEAERREWEREQEEAEERRRQWEAERRGWDREREEEQEEAEKRRRQLEAERRGWEREQEEAEGRRRQWEAEEEARQRAQIHWLALESSQHCERYGTRKYWAKMGPLVGGYDPMKACWTSEIEIHGRKMKPTYCEEGAYHGVYGNWIVDFDEGGCRPWWEGFTDKGCTAPGSGLRRFDAHLINLDKADAWNVMCASTPADFNGLHFNGAMSCVNTYFSGVFGIWDIQDGDCH